MRKAILAFVAKQEVWAGALVVMTAPVGPAGFTIHTLLFIASTFAAYM